MPFEAGLITESLRNKRQAPPFVKGIIGGKKAAFICSGIGITNAAHALSVLIAKESPDAVILFGIGGAYPASGLKVGDIAVADAEIYGDSGAVSPSGEQMGFRQMGFPLLSTGGRKYFNLIPLDKTLLEKAKRRISGLKTGRFITVASASRSFSRGKTLEKKHRGIVENMEGAAAAQIALLYGVPLLEIRGISNIVGEPPRKWNKDLAAINCQMAVLELIKAL